VISEKCSCGARFKTDEPEAIKLVRDWRKNHTCQNDEVEIDFSPTHGLSDNQIAFGFQPGELPAKKYDPWDE
jgi:hypothetical protein